MSKHTVECSGCIAEYNGECAAETCRGKILCFACNPRKQADSKERHRKAYAIADDELRRSFDDGFIEEDME